MHGVINLLKPPGMTSHDAVAFVRRIAGTKRVGHIGTLDPAAAGVLPLCIGEATKLVEYLQAGRKRYIAEAVFGIETNTLDTTGAVARRCDAGAVSAAAIEAVLGEFIGELDQIPPQFSAIKQDGKKLYEMARAGAVVEVAPRRVTVHGLSLSRFMPHASAPRALFCIDCGSGTYVRSLLRDIGQRLGCGATMRFLVRGQSGQFSLENAQTPEELTADLHGALLPFLDVLCSCAALTIGDNEVVGEYLAGRTRRSSAAEERYRVGEYQTARLLFINDAKTEALLSGAPLSADSTGVKLFHLH